MKSRTDTDLNAWCDYPQVEVPRASSGPLAGLTLAVKDIFQVAGYKNGWGQPTRLANCDVDVETQPAVQQMLDGGIEVLGKSQCVEFCYSLTGINVHYGTPLNPAAHDRLPGGSSSGSVSLVAAGVVDVATGSDTGGSVRCPASYCGLVGLRTTHGRISLDKTMPLAPSLDVFGWFAKDMEIYVKVGDVLLGEDKSATPLTRLIGSPDLDSLLLGDDEYLAYSKAAEGLEKQLDGEWEFFSIPEEFEQGPWAFNIIGGYEAWREHGAWIEKHRPDLGPDIKLRLEFGKKITKQDYEKALGIKKIITGQLEGLLGEDGLLVFPTVPSVAPLLSEDYDTLEEFRSQSIKLLSLSGLSGLPQITLPLCKVYGAPMGLSLMGPRGSDKRLIEIAGRVMG